METVGVFGIVFGILARFWPVWIALAILFVSAYMFKPRLGLFGELLNTGVGIAGVAICAFWLFTAIFASVVAPFDPLAAVGSTKNLVPGAQDSGTGYVFLFGTDQLARDVFSRMVYGARIVLAIAPAATLIGQAQASNVLNP